LKKQHSAYTYDYDKESDILRINNKNCNYQGKNQIDTKEVYPGIWVIFKVCNSKCFLSIEIMKATRRNLNQVNDFLEKHYNITVKDPIA
jgi:hypothetical protein